MLRSIVALLRLLGLVVLLLAGLALGALAMPWLAQSGRNRIERGWARALVLLCGLRVTVSGDLPAELGRTGMLAGRRGRLLLVNHVSWIDVFALASVLPPRFVAKAEISNWPLVGTLVSMTGTLYIERGRRRAVHAMNQRVRECLLAGETVAVFPEGTTTDGSRLLPFHANLVAAALGVDCEVWPVALRYTRHGHFDTTAAFTGEMTLLRSVWRILTARGLAVEITLLPPLRDGHAAADRHRIAEQARAAIAARLGIALDDQDG